MLDTNTNTLVKSLLLLAAGYLVGIKVYRLTTKNNVNKKISRKPRPPRHSKSKDVHYSELTHEQKVDAFERRL
jgi:hypothetical protein